MRSIRGEVGGRAVPLASGMARPLISVAPGRGKGVPERPRWLSTPIIYPDMRDGIGQPI